MRRPYQHYPSHCGRFTGEPAYFRHITAATRELMAAMGTTPADYTYAVFHQPNVKFPQTVARQLGFKPEQIEAGLLVDVIGNTYAAAALLGLTAVLDQARPGDRILVVSFGSGAGSDAISLHVTEAIAERQHRAPYTRDYCARRVEIDYALYTRYRRKLLV